MSTTTQHADPENTVDGSDAKTHHGAGFFVAIWVALLILLFVSISLGSIQDPYVMNAAVFSVAVVKALLVLFCFMHFRVEPKGIAAVVLFAMLCLLFVWKGASPDVPYDERHPQHQKMVEAPSL